MKATDSGIELTKPEIVALLAFTAKDADDPFISSVCFTVTRTTVTAHATDGHSAVLAEADTDGVAPSGRWVIRRAFLEATARAIRGKSRALIDLYSDGPVRESAILRTEEDEDGNEIEKIVHSVVWPESATVNEADLPADADRSVVITKPERAVPCMTIDASYLARAELIGKAAKRAGVDVWGSTSRQGPLGLEVDAATRWRALIMPCAPEEAPDGITDVDQAATKFEEEAS